jgi:methylated-DNA-[protein]-cysteine S-methyltransferase
MINQISVNTKFGWVSAYETNGEIFRIKFGKLKKQIKSEILKEFKKNLLNFFNKKKNTIKTPHVIRGNSIQKKVWLELTKIKFGQTRSYGEIAKKFKLSPRYVGKICSQNKLLLLVPCHRVIRTNGDMGGFTSVGGVKLKKKLLVFESN